MAVITATSGSNALTTTSSGTANNGLSAITGEDFMNLLIKQLQYQDPLQPMTNQEMMQQMSTIRQLEMNTTLTSRLQQLTGQQSFGSAASLIGKHVKGAVADANGNAFKMEGVVKSVLFTPKGDVLLELEDGSNLPLANLEQVMGS
jgi:flagellar basal-body rod modification protein FlgD